MVSVLLGTKRKGLVPLPQFLDLSRRASLPEPYFATVPSYMLADFTQNLQFTFSGILPSAQIFPSFSAASLPERCKGSCSALLLI